METKTDPIAWGALEVLAGTALAFTGMVRIRMTAALFGLFLAAHGLLRLIFGTPTWPMSPESEDGEDS